MTDKLSIFQGSCAAIGCRRITSLTEDRLPLRELNGVWDRGGLRTCLSTGYYKFATRTQAVTYDPAIEPDFGYARVFEKGGDWILTAGVSGNESFNPPLTAYRDEGGFLFADLDTLYVSFISDDAAFGGDFSLWPENFTRYVEGWFGLQVHERLVNNNDKKVLHERTVKRLLVETKAKDALDGPAKFLPQGTWSTSRRGNVVGRDRGSRTNLIG